MTSARMGRWLLAMGWVALGVGAACGGDNDTPDPCGGCDFRFACEQVESSPGSNDGTYECVCSPGLDQGGCADDSDCLEGEVCSEDCDCVPDGKGGAGGTGGTGGTGGAGGAGDGGNGSGSALCSSPTCMNGMNCPPMPPAASDPCPPFGSPCHYCEGGDLTNVTGWLCTEFDPWMSTAAIDCTQ